VTCPITGTAIVELVDNRPSWHLAEPEVHISDELLQSPRARAFIEGRYAIAWCDDMQAWHATTDHPTTTEPEGGER
jgi:hypothetical protein